jgi:lactate dehydrogenase-like 2-hydroxyacid dehydrogenase
MIDELSTGRISAGLDVFSNEPKINPALLGLDNVVILPHMGTE